MTTRTKLEIPYEKWCCGNCQQKRGDKCITKSGLPNGYVMSGTARACRILPETYVDRGFIIKGG